MVERLFLFLGRFCLSIVFLSSAFSKLFDWNGAEQYLVAQLQQFLSLTLSSPNIQTLGHLGLDSPNLLLTVATGLELVGSLSLLLGFFPKLGAFLLIVFLIPTTVVAHHFWLLSTMDRDLQMVMFLKNLSILGGLLLVFAIPKSKKTASKPKS